MTIMWISVYVWKYMIEEKFANSFGKYFLIINTFNMLLWYMQIIFTINFLNFSSLYDAIGPDLPNLYLTFKLNFLYTGEVMFNLCFQKKGQLK